MANEFTIAGDLEITVAAATDGSIGIFTDATKVGAYRFGVIGGAFDSASISYNHNTTQMIFDIGGTDEIIIDASGGTTVTTIAADLVITGDLTVSGTTTTVNSTNLEITDNKILLNDGEAGAGVTLGTAGLEIDRGPATENSCWVYNDTDDWWEPRDVSDTSGSLPAFKTIGNLEAIDTTNAGDSLTITGTGTIKIPVGTTGQEPGASNGMLRYDSDTDKFRAVINGSWVDVDGALNNIIEDTTPQLGGQLDINTFGLGDGTNLLLDFVEDASSVNHIEIENEATGGGPIIRAVGSDTNVDLHLASKGTGEIILDDVAVLPIFTVAGAPTATAGAVAYFSNGAAGSPVLAFGNGTNWLRCDTLATISAS